MSTYRVGYLVGSLSSTSINRTLSQALVNLAPKDLEFTEIPIAHLPLCSPDFDNDYPAEARPLKELIAAVGPELVRPHARGRHRRVHRTDRDGGRATEPARSSASATPGR